MTSRLFLVVIAGVRILVAVTASLLATSAVVASPSNGKIDYDLTGRVLDADTNEPLDGAYVIAVYKIQKAGIAAVASFCVKTLGMYTGQDGKYHFPVEKLDGRSPFWTQAIKSGYFWKTTLLHDSDVWQRQDAKAYSGRDILLKKQDPSKPNWHLGNKEEFCHSAPTAAAAAAGVAYLELELAEYERYGRGAQQRQALREQIQMLRKLPQIEPAK